MKKIALFFTTIILTLSFSSSTFAVVDINELIQKPDNDTDMEATLSGTEAYEGLPSLSFEQIVGGGIQLVLKWATYLSLIAIVLAGINFLVSEGDEEKTTKAKKTLLYVVLGSLIISVAYAVTIGISQFDFFADTV